MESQYSGSCKICGANWDPGDVIFYQKDPKCICSSKECFESQKKKGYGTKPESKQAKLDQRTDEQRLIDCNNMIDLLWPAALAHSRKYHSLEGVDQIGLMKNKDVVIFAEVLFKAMVRSWNR